jgi:hypothetical protein
MVLAQMAAQSGSFTCLARPRRRRLWPCLPPLSPAAPAMAGVERGLRDSA